MNVPSGFRFVTRWRATLLRAAFVACLLQGVALAPAQTPAPEIAALRARISELFEQARQAKVREVLDGVEAIRKAAIGARDFRLLQDFYVLAAWAHAELGNKDVALHNNFLLYMIDAVAFDSWTTARSELTLAGIYEERRLEIALQIAATNALGALRRLKAENPNAPDIDKNMAYAHGFLGGSYFRDKRPELALRDFRAARALALPGVFDAASLQRIDERIVELASTVSTNRAPHAAGACQASPDLTEERTNECLKRADEAALDSESTVASAILRELVADIRDNNLTDARVAAARALHLQLVRELPPDHADVVASAIRLGHRLALQDAGLAVLVALRSAAATIKSGAFESRLAKLAGHIAYRAATNSTEDIAIRMLDTQIFLLNQGYSKGLNFEKLLELEVEQTMVMLEAASLSELNGYAGLAKLYLRFSDMHIDNLAKQPFSKVSNLAFDYTKANYGFVFPGPVAVTELLGRLAERAPTEPDREKALVMWIAFEEMVRGNTVRTLEISARLIAKQRGVAGREELLASLLSLRADYVEDPLAADALRREAYEILTRLPNTREKQFDLLVEIANHSLTAGDHVTASRLAEAARVLAETEPVLDSKRHALLVLWRLREALTHDLPPSEAIALAEEALRRVVAATPEKHLLRSKAAKTLANLLANADRFEEARQLYEVHVFPAVPDAIEVGQAAAQSERIGLIALEAYHQPKATVLVEIERLLSRLGLRARQDEALQRRVARIEAFARNGLGQFDAALVAGRRALSLRKVIRNDKVDQGEDRTLLETIVGAAVMAAAQIEGGPAPR